MGAYLFGDYNSVHNTDYDRGEFWILNAGVESLGISGRIEYPIRKLVAQQIQQLPFFKTQQAHTVLIARVQT